MRDFRRRSSGPSYFLNHDERFKLKSYGIFGEAYVDITDRLKVTAGVRYNNDKKNDTSNSLLANFLVPYGTNGKRLQFTVRWRLRRRHGSNGLAGTATVPRAVRRLR